MKQFSILVLIGLLNILGLNSNAVAAPVSLAKAAELTCHRLERLAVLKKIDGTFLTQLKSVEVQILAQANPADPYFKATASQYPGADGSINQVDVYMDDQGKSVSSAVKSGSAAQGAPIWPDKDAVTLTENSMHYVLDGWQTDPTLTVFYNGMTGLLLTQVVGPMGAVVSRSEIHSKDTSQVLEVLLKADGTLLSAKIYTP